MSSDNYYRILALDYGRRRIGAAVSDPLRITAQGIEALVINNFDDGVKKVLGLISNYDNVEVVLGLPLHMDGSEGDMVEEVKKFGSKLVELSGVKLDYLDERLTSVMAERTLIEMGIKTGHNKGKIDTMAAVFLLQTYLARNSR